MLSRFGTFLLGTVSLFIFLAILTIGVIHFFFNFEHHSRRAVVGNLKEAKQYVIDFNKNHGRLPKTEEFNNWANNKFGDPVPYEYHKSNFPSDLIRLAGEPPSGAFYFDAWNGEIFAYYASWYKDGSVGLVPDREYYFGGSAYMHYLIIFLPLLIFWAIAFFALRYTFVRR
ncbi:MAG TPA: hypothetical protein PL131_06980 [Methylotenera sp.]|nr:hypothetical protein [Methylotenera sp.]HPH05603.1 hypothetical protein [Methylotenera sp.]HPM99982.1 hypothetical protein [Methylotenera sp.]